MSCQLLRHQQCCCTCRYHIADHSHPETDGQHVTHQRGWVCLGLEVAISDWPEHGLCECWEPAGQPIRDEIIQAAYDAGVVTEDSDDEVIDLLYALADLAAIVQQVNEEAGPAVDEAWTYE